jgi:hypothetical protein
MVTEMGTTEPKRQQVFISYSSADEVVARRIASDLRRAGIPVLIADSEIASGDFFTKLVDKTISSRDILLVLLSRTSVRSRWVQAELSAALSGELRDRGITVIPALIEDSEGKSPAALPLTLGWCA